MNYQLKAQELELGYSFVAHMVYGGSPLFKMHGALATISDFRVIERYEQKFLKCKNFLETIWGTLY